MDAERFEWWTRRRFGLAAGVLAALLGNRLTTSEVAARKKRKKPPRLNAFGCVALGGKCRGKDGVCCSGICAGKKPKDGGKDVSRCVAHNTGICQPGQGSSVCGDGFETCESSVGDLGLCYTTTGNAGYCAPNPIFCAPCAKDADCRPLCGAGAACIRCAGDVGCATGTACAGAGAESCAGA